MASISSPSLSLPSPHIIVTIDPLPQPVIPSSQQLEPTSIPNQVIVSIAFEKMNQLTLSRTCSSSELSDGSLSYGNNDPLNSSISISIDNYLGDSDDNTIGNIEEERAALNHDILNNQQRRYSEISIASSSSLEFSDRFSHDSLTTPPRRHSEVSIASSTSSSELSDKSESPLNVSVSISVNTNSLSDQEILSPEQIQKQLAELVDKINHQLERYEMQEKTGMTEDSLKVILSHLSDLKRQFSNFELKHKNSLTTAIRATISKTEAEFDQIIEGIKRDNQMLLSKEFIFKQEDRAFNEIARNRYRSETKRRSPWALRCAIGCLAILVMGAIAIQQGIAHSNP